MNLSLFDSPNPVPKPPGPHLLVFDLETQRSAAEVGGWDQAHRMGLSVAVCWDSRRADFVAYNEKQVEALVAHLRQADLVVGFNLLGFDYAVLRGYTPFDFWRLNTLDILYEVRLHLGHRVRLDSLAQATLGSAKLGDGMQALAWWTEGRLDLLEEYCRQDVRVTRDLFDYGLEHGHLLYDRQGGPPARIDLDWNLDDLAARHNAGTGTP